MFISDERVSILCVCSKSMNVKQMPCSAYHRCWTKMSIRHCSTKRNVSKSSTKTWWHKWVETQLSKIARIYVQLCVCRCVCWCRRVWRWDMCRSLTTQARVVCCFYQCQNCYPMATTLKHVPWINRWGCQWISIRTCLFIFILILIFFFFTA